MRALVWMTSAALCTASLPAWAASPPDAETESETDPAESDVDATEGEGDEASEGDTEEQDPGIPEMGRPTPIVDESAGGAPNTRDPDPASDDGPVEGPEAEGSDGPDPGERRFHEGNTPPRNMTVPLAIASGSMLAIAAGLQVGAIVLDNKNCYKPIADSGLSGETDLRLEWAGCRFFKNPIAGGLRAGAWTALTFSAAATIGIGIYKSEKDAYQDVLDYVDPRPTMRWNLIGGATVLGALVMLGGAGALAFGVTCRQDEAEAFSKCLLGSSIGSAILLDGGAVVGGIGGAMIGWAQMYEGHFNTWNNRLVWRIRPSTGYKQAGLSLSARF